MRGRTGRISPLLMLAGVVLALIAALIGSAGRDARAATASVQISNFQFSPAPVTVNVGDTVTWTNSTTAGTLHTTTSDTGAWDSGTLAPGASFSMVFATAGTFTYHCSFHPTMTGSVVAQQAVSPSPSPSPSPSASPSPSPSPTPTATATATTTAVATATPTRTTASTLPATATTGSPTSLATPRAPTTGQATKSDSLNVAWLLGAAAVVAMGLGAAGVVVSRRDS